MQLTSISDLFSLQGKVALVTGASGDIGYALAAGLALAGARVALTGRSASKLARAQQKLSADGYEVATFVADISRHEELTPLVDAVLAQFQRIDILVNCAGVNHRQTIPEVTTETYDQIMDTNVRGLYFLSQAVMPHMQQQGGGRIINIGSLTSTIGLHAVSAYGMSKAAVAQLTKSMAIELAPANITVNCICPGFIATELTVPLWQNQRRRQWIIDRLPIQRPGKPEDLVGIAIYLASDTASYTTGQAIYVDGGFLAGSQW